jgi:hypothetical protein
VLTSGGGDLETTPPSVPFSAETDGATQMNRVFVFLKPEEVSYRRPPHATPGPWFNAPSRLTPNSSKTPNEAVTIISPTSGLTTVRVCLASGLNSFVAISQETGMARIGSFSFAWGSLLPSGAD